MDTEHRAIAELLALTDAPDEALLDQVEAISERVVRHMLCDEVPGCSILTKWRRTAPPWPTTSIR
jgi:hypothetical protein